MNIIEDKVIVNDNTDDITSEDTPVLIQKAIHESNDEDDDKPVQLVSHDEGDYYDSSDSDSSDSYSDDQDKYDVLYDDPDLIYSPIKCTSY